MSGLLKRLFGKAEVDRSWRRHLGSKRMVSEDDARSTVVKMSFGYHGEIFVEFADGRSTCVWPSGEPVRPFNVRVGSPVSRNGEVRS